MSNKILLCNAGIYVGPGAPETYEMEYLLNPSCIASVDDKNGFPCSSNGTLIDHSDYRIDKNTGKIYIKYKRTSTFNFYYNYTDSKILSNNLIQINYSNTSALNTFNRIKLTI